ncbi:MAG: hypothetical protein AW07_04547 [Candidatus Accumulibacter sp. SK-11]|nr:MAG: hypothetical protein AW07_04547 [Candidatus Accumulibacter sp. SK-11]
MIFSSRARAGRTIDLAGNRSAGVPRRRNAAAPPFGRHFPARHWWHNARSTTCGKTIMDTATAAIDWGAVALGICVAAGLLWGLLFFLRQNRQDLASLEQTLRDDRDESDDRPPGAT